MKKLTLKSRTVMKVLITTDETGTLKAAVKWGGGGERVALGVETVKAGSRRVRN